MPLGGIEDISDGVSTRVATFKGIPSGVEDDRDRVSTGIDTLKRYSQKG